MRILFALLGGMALLLGLIGAFLPILPTTPFILLSAFLFGKSSPRVHLWLMNHPWCGPLIHDWQIHRGVRAHVRRRALLMMALSFSFSIYIVPIWQVKVGLGFIFIVLVLWFLRLPVVRDSAAVALKQTRP